MNISTSECSSGCESGWTTYLDQLSNSTNPYNRQNHEVKGANVNEEDEDLSMVSDASSGPPHLHESYGTVDTHCYGFASPVQEDKKKGKQKTSRTKETKMKKQHNNFCLDDTASSPMLHFSQANHFSHAFSTSHFEEEGTPEKNVGFLKSSTKGKSGTCLPRFRDTKLSSKKA
ncbi:hypothetical protein C2S52_013886 [Perilla frutescens var. hirtella]|nr:hypothetical protein C2S51_016135 [Perilla frutescens var. frutescens]KAH6776325.1 hypothetical protein C2S52_013886 [Perilla frutescens var. hirtella]